MKKKKLLVMTSTFPRWKNDTLPPFVYELSRRLTDKFDVTVLAPGFPGAKDYEVMDKMKVHRFHYFLRPFEKLAGSGGILPTLKKNLLYYSIIPFFLFAEYLALKKLIKEIQPDIIHAHWIIPQGYIASLIKKSTGIPYVVTTHGGDIFGLQGKIMADIKRQTLRNAKRITVVSNAIKNEILNKLDSKLKIDVIPMGVDSKLFNPNKKDNSIKRKYGITGPFLLFVGRLAEKKGVRYLIEAMPAILEKHPKTKLMIIGTGTLEGDLRKLIEVLKVKNSVFFMGAVKNRELPKYYATADIFIGPSIRAKGGDTEGLGLTFVEAGMSGCWMVGTNIGGISDIIINNKNGFLVKEKNSIEISLKIIESLNTIFKFKWKIDINLKKRFDWEIIKGKYCEVMLK